MIVGAGAAGRVGVAAGVGSAAGGKDAVVAVGQAHQDRRRQLVSPAVAGEGGLAAGDGEPLGQLGGPALPWLVGDPSSSRSRCAADSAWVALE